MTLRNAWYMAAWDRDLTGDGPMAMTMLGEPIVLYRTDQGRVVAMEDRCVHRLAPLSLGRCEGANLRCMYHGLLFAPDGACIEIPNQPVIPGAARVRVYPAVERYNAIWLWMGAADAADETLIPPFVGYADPAWAMIPGRIDYAAPATLINDNLLDLSHLAFVHANSFGGGVAASGQGWVQADMTVTVLPRGVRVSRWMRSMPSTPAGGASAGEMSDVFSSYDFLVPGIFLQTTHRFPVGTADRWAGERPDGGESRFSTFTCQAVTPLTDETACYFFAYGPWAAAADRSQFFADLGVRAFEEDRAMIEAQHKIIRATQRPRMMPMVMDKAVTTYAGVLKRLLREESARSADVSPEPALSQAAAMG